MTKAVSVDACVCVHCVVFKYMCSFCVCVVLVSNDALCLFEEALAGTSVNSRTTATFLLHL